MPSLQEAFAALVAHAASADVAPDRQYVAFPNFYYPLDADDLDLTKAPTAFAFALNTNMMPDEAPQFRLSGNFAWTSYQKLLRDRVLATGGDTGSFARQFVETQAQLGDGLLDPSSELPYFTTAVIPVDLADPRAWTPVSLDAAAIRAQSQTLSPDHATWLKRFNLLGRLGEDFVDGVTLERLVVVILRAWYNEAVFGWQFWDLPGTIVSDGAANPRGVLPGVIKKLVLVRKLRVILAASAPPDAGPTVMFRRVGEAGNPAGPANRMTELAQFARETHTVDRSRAAFKAFRTSTASVNDRVKALDAAAAHPTQAEAAPVATDTGCAGGRPEISRTVLLRRHEDTCTRRAAADRGCEQAAGARGRTGGASQRDRTADTTGCASADRSRSSHPWWSHPAGADRSRSSHPWWSHPAGVPGFHD